MKVPSVQNYVKGGKVEPLKGLEKRGLEALKVGRFPQQEGP